MRPIFKSHDAPFSQAPQDRGSERSAVCRIFRLGLPLALTVLALTACSSERLVTRYYGSAPNAMFSSAAAKGEFGVSVLSSPVAGMSAAEAVPTVLAAMQGRSRGPSVQFVEDGKADMAHPGFRAVWFFDGPNNVSGTTLCSGEMPDSQPGSKGDLAIQLVFCSGDEVLTEVEGWAPRPSGINDPQLAVAIGRATSLMLPYRDDKDSNCSRTDC